MAEPSVLHSEQPQLLSDHVLQSLPNPVLVIDGSDEIAFANLAALSELGDDVIGRSAAEIFPTFLRSALSSGVGQLRLASRKGAVFHGLPSRLAHDAICLSLWCADEPPQQRTAEVDELTGLPRRGEIMNAVARSLRGSDEAEAAVLFIDLDRFKLINDTLGHGIGDELLKKVADRLRGACRPDDVVARLGGDEFAILQRGTSDGLGAHRLAARVVDLIGRTYVLGGHTINIGASVGVALGRPGLQARDMLRDADIALYAAKRAGRNRYVVFEDSMAETLQYRRELEVDLRRALALRQFRLHFQPFVDVTTKEVTGFEALLRWQHPVRGNVPPLSFIPLAEENRLIVRIGDWVIRTACAAAAEWPAPLVVAVNVSPIQFHDNALLQTVSSALSHSGLDPSRLEIEITEGALLEDTDNVLRTLHALRELGVKISLDDFGTGYSSLSYLSKFPFNKIKIDRSFVVNTGADSDAIVSAVSGLGNSLGVQITAEGVETADQYERVRSQLCTHVQGYLTGRPIPGDEIAAFLSHDTRGFEE